jgi:hypothetical protein
MSTTTPLPASATLLQEIESGALKFLSAELTSNQAAFESDVTLIESDAVAGLANLLKNIPTVKGIAGLAVGPVESLIESALTQYAQQLVTQYGPSVLYAATQALLAKLAADV